MEKDWLAILKDIRWSVLKNDLVHKADIKVTEREIIESYVQEITRYLGAYANEQMVNTLVASMLKDEEKVEARFQAILSNKVLAYVATKITKKTEYITPEVLKSMLEKSDNSVEVDEA